MVARKPLRSKVRRKVLPEAVFLALPRACKEKETERAVSASSHFVIDGSRSDVRTMIAVASTNVDDDLEKLESVCKVE